MQQLERSDIQGIILSGYGQLRYSAYLFLQFGEAARAKKWLGSIHNLITPAFNIGNNGTAPKRIIPFCVNIAFTNSGLETLGVNLNGFSTEFKEGITGVPTQNDRGAITNRSLRLGDTDSSAPDLWEVGGPANERLDAMLMLFAIDSNSLRNLQEQHNDLLAAGNIRIVLTQEAYRPTHDREPFGFMDGLSQPHIEGNEIKPNGDNQPAIKAGEFLLGYRNEYGLYPPQPAVPTLARNGSYMVFRKLEQDVVGFWNYIYQAANGDASKAEFIGAKMVGRWRSGAPMILSPDEDNPALVVNREKSNDFHFIENDRLGYGCPIASHIRRTNPRDSLMPDAEASKLTVNRHRILRRGRIYGPEYGLDVVESLVKLDPPINQNYFSQATGSPKGLAQIIINADIKRQFEFIQQTWVNDPKFDGLFDDRDPIIGNNGEQVGSVYNMTFGRRPVRKQLKKIPRFVTVKGGAYMFLPSISGLKWLAG